MIIIDLLCPDVPVIINGQEIPPMDLRKHKGAGLKGTYQGAVEDPAGVIKEEVCKGGRNMIFHLCFKRQHFCTQRKWQVLHRPLGPK